VVAVPGSFQPTTYGPIFTDLLAQERLNPLGPGTPNRAVYGKLAALSLQEAFAPHAIRDQEMARACLAGLWLYHDFLDESHRISQEIATTTGSYWHGIMHRREPDYSNSRYWFRRVGTHPVFEPLRVEAARLAAGQTGQGAFLAAQAAWDPFAFVDLCEQASRQNGPLEELCRQVQRAEWELLFDYCYRQAVER
jgi:hypothetical protein